MIVKALRRFSRLDRSYFFATSALISGLVVTIALLFAPIVQSADGSDISLLERDGAIVIILLLLPLFVLATPLVSLPQITGPIDRSHKINASAATFILFVFIGISLSSFGLFYVPSFIFSTASTISLFFGRGGKAPREDAGGRPLDEDGIRLSRSALRRQREEERLATGGDGIQDASPLASSRRRRGRNRRKR